MKFVEGMFFKKSKNGGTFRHTLGMAFTDRFGLNQNSSMWQNVKCFIKGHLVVLLGQDPYQTPITLSLDLDLSADSFLRCAC